MYDDKQVIFDYVSEKWPEEKLLLYSVVNDATYAYNNDTFEDFCSNYGYSDDSIKALKLYESCKDMKEKLLYVFGEKLFTRFIECELDL